MLEIKTLLTDIGRITHGAIRRRAFWLNYAKLSMVLMGLATLIFWPAYKKARTADHVQLTRIFDDRRQVMASHFTRIPRLFESVLRGATPGQRRGIMELIREYDRYPGVVAVGLARPGKTGLEISADESVATIDDGEFRAISGNEAFVQNIQETFSTGSNHVSAVFWNGPPSDDANRAYFAFATRGPGWNSEGRPSQPKVLFAVINLKRLIVYAGRPASLNLIEVRLSNASGQGPSVNMDDVVRPGDSARTPVLEIRPENPKEADGFKEGLRLLELDNANSSDLDQSRRGSGRTAYLRMIAYPNREFRISVYIKNAFLKSSAVRALIVAMPYYILQILIIAFLMVLMWTVFSASRSQMKELAEAQSTIARLNLHRTLVQQELHDHIIQNLTLLGVQVATSRIDDAAGFARTRDLILQQLDYLRRELRRLLVEGTERLQSFDEMAVQLQSICTQMEKRFNVRCPLTTSNTDGLNLHPEVLFRTCRFAEELLGNAIRHGRARNITMRVECFASPSMLFLRVADDGNGFDPANYSAGFGLQSMNAFARRSRGQLRIERRSPKGMLIELMIPVKLSPPAT
jgi:signal transduction histidine kinase